MTIVERKGDIPSPPFEDIVYGRKREPKPTEPDKN